MARRDGLLLKLLTADPDGRLTGLLADYGHAVPACGDEGRGHAVASPHEGGKRRC
ncbi:MAG: hypothetical protein WDN48_04275 [Pseudolabrys sp.]